MKAVVIIINFLSTVTFTCKITLDGTSIICDDNGVDLDQLEIDDGKYNPLLSNSILARSGPRKTDKRRKNFVKNVGALKEMKHLTSFLAEESGLADLPDKMFKFNDQLMHLVFSHNQISNIPEDLLPENATSITEIRFDHNNLQKIPSKFFDVGKTPNLEVIHLEFNFLVRLPELFLKSLPNLKELYLHDNLLVSLGRSYDFVKKSNIGLYGLPFSGVQFASKMRAIYLHNNYLPTTSFNKNIFGKSKELKILNVANNRLAWLDEATFSGLNSLSHLYLEGNFFREIEPNLFNSTKNLQYLYLGSNLLKRLPFGLFAENPKLVKLGLDDNFIVPDGLKGIFLREKPVEMMGGGFFRSGPKSMEKRPLDVKYEINPERIKLPQIDLRYNSDLDFVKQ